jgi:hypothetical protein
MSMKHEIKKFLTKHRDELDKFKELNNSTFCSFIKFLNKRFHLSIKDTDELYKSMKRYEKCRSENNLNSLISLILNNLNGKRRNKLNNKSDVKKIETTILSFFSSIKADPTFISLDSAFVSNGNETNYQNLVIYFKRKSEELVSLLNLGPLYTVSLNIMDDQFLPLFSSMGSNDKYNLYKNGEITYKNRDTYTTLIHTLQTGQDSKILNTSTLSLSTKLGVAAESTVEYTGTVTASQISAAIATLQTDASNLTVFFEIVIIIFAIIFIFYP